MREGALHSFPCTLPGRTALFTRDLLDASPNPHFCPLSHHPRRICFHLHREAPPHAPRSHSKNPRGAGSAVQIRLEVAGYTGGAAGSEDRGSEAVALWQNLGTLGATQALQGRASALRHAGVCGR